MDSSWENVQEVPPRNKITLNPGQVMRRKITGRTLSGTYFNSFKKQGKLDYHAAERTIDGVKWLYIWRDAAAGAKAELPQAGPLVSPSGQQ